MKNAVVALLLLLTVSTNTQDTIQEQNFRQPNVTESQQNQTYTKSENSTGAPITNGNSTINTKLNNSTEAPIIIDSSTIYVPGEDIHGNKSSTTSPTTTPAVTTIKPSTTTKPSTPVPTTALTTVSTTTPTTTTSHVTTTNGTSTTTQPKPTAGPSTPAPTHHRGFDGPSFVGGIVLALGLVAIGFVAFKFYKARTEMNYHTL